MIAAAAPQNSKQTPIRSQEDSCASCTVSDDVFTSEGASVSPKPSSSTGSQSHHLDVGVANARSLASLSLDAQTPSPQLARSHIWT